MLGKICEPPDEVELETLTHEIVTVEEIVDMKEENAKIVDVKEENAKIVDVM